MVTCSCPCGGHLHALEHATGEGTRTDRARGTVALVVAVAGALALEVVALHRPAKALPRSRRHVDPGAGSEDLDGELWPTSDRRRIEAQLGRGAYLGPRWPSRRDGFGLLSFFSARVTSRSPQCGVSVALCRLDMHDEHRFDTKHSHGHDTVVDPLLVMPTFSATIACCAMAAVLIELWGCTFVDLTVGCWMVERCLAACANING